ncbi:hypothetical protein [Allorhodopirellula heiligendammensis]|uniref:hypothetical protein n=1 Tax=Allorhodopirellula heiligendammensis TaxID=2714739 RepID=UPI0011B6285E|nr:hypothetical protein [Allorhodopirellula heiligendammensis]
MSFRFALVALGASIALLVSFYLAWPSKSKPYKDIEIEVVGSEFAFYFRYPGADRTLFTQDDRHGASTLFVPAGARVHLKLSSLDYLYTLEIPAREIYEMAAPDLILDSYLEASPPQELELLGSQMCGYDHSSLLGKLIVLSPSDFDRTMNTLSKQTLIPN